MPLTSDEQIRFMVNIQRLLDEGLFTASYKFAFLIGRIVRAIVNLVPVYSAPSDN
jgi:hypothetical protein